jgi:thioredoxin 1
MAVANLIKVTDADFSTEIEQYTGVALVDFWAVWCGPCQMVAPIVEQIAKEYDGKVKVAKLDVDENPQTTMRFNVRSIPSLLIFKDGKHVETVVGAVPKAYLVEKLARHLS